MIAWFARNGIAANLLVVFIIFAGGLSIRNLEIRLFPVTNLERINISVPFRGAAPQEVEKQIIEPIEEILDGLEGIEEVRSSASESLGHLTLVLQRNYDMNLLLNRVKSRVDSIQSFPENAERPIIEEQTFRESFLEIVLYGDVATRDLRILADELERDLKDELGLSQLEIAGVPDYEMTIEVDPYRLQAYGLTPEMIAVAIRQSSLDIPSGSLKNRAGSILLRTQGQAYTQSDFESIIIQSYNDGSFLHLGEIANVIDGFQDVPLKMRFNGKPAVSLIISQGSGENIVELSRKIEAYLEIKKDALPEGVSASIFRDTSFYLKSRIQLLTRNGIAGFILVLLVLTLFLDPKIGIWVALGIPISFLGTFAILPLLGVSINLLSLFGFILVLGIVVDDAIIIGESIFSKFKHKGVSHQSVIEGTKQVAIPVTFAVLTTMLVFLPFLSLPGFEGQFFRPIAIVVVLTLLFSLIESKCILPYHLLVSGYQKEKKDNFF